LHTRLFTYVRDSGFAHFLGDDGTECDEHEEQQQLLHEQPPADSDLKTLAAPIGGAFGTGSTARLEWADQSRPLWEPPP
ncbi:MAG: hypothetical protein QOI08_450, partial [Actinomycetota bacterium]|nr:hypothetical protein [Actinomycetota bacterium]